MYPKHPNEVLIKNIFYPRGLTELDVWSYYDKNKEIILKEVDNRDVFFIIAVGINKVIFKRKFNDKFVKLNKNNWNKLITGRTLSIHSSFRRYDDIAIIDIDSDNFNNNKIACLDTYNFVKSSLTDIVKDVYIKYTGKTGFHVVCFLYTKRNIDSIRRLFKNRLETSELAEKYTINVKRGIVPNLDLSSMKYRGGFITLASLSVLGLRSMKIDPSKIRSLINIKLKLYRRLDMKLVLEETRVKGKNLKRRIEIKVPYDDYALPELLDSLIVPALLAWGYVQESITNSFASYIDEMATEYQDEDKIDGD